MINIVNPCNNTVSTMKTTALSRSASNSIDYGVENDVYGDVGKGVTVCGRG